MKITVTQDDIDCGFRSNCHLCPIARAIARETGRHSKFIRFDSPERIEVGCEVYQTSDQNVINFILDFDCGKPVQPFSFEMSEISIDEYESEDYSGDQ